MVQGDTCTNKAKDLIVKGRWRGEQRGEGTPENCSASWLAVSGFMVVGLAFRVVSGPSSCSCPYLVSPGPFLVARATLSQDSFQRERFWEVGRTYHGLASPPSFWPLPNSSGWFWRQLAVPCSLLGPPTVR